jgi:hypothetical protein
MGPTRWSLTVSASWTMRASRRHSPTPSRTLARRGTAVCHSRRLPVLFSGRAHRSHVCHLRQGGKDGGAICCRLCLCGRPVPLLLHRASRRGRELPLCVGARWSKCECHRAVVEVGILTALVGQACLAPRPRPQSGCVIPEASPRGTRDRTLFVRRLWSAPRLSPLVTALLTA